jgi:hypothetical protein
MARERRERRGEEEE